VKTHAVQRATGKKQDKLEAWDRLLNRRIVKAVTSGGEAFAVRQAA
jgi:hypothetical protein